MGTNIIKGCYSIKQSKGLKCYLRIMLKMGNLMNHGIMDKSMCYGFSLESLSLLEGIKNFGGNKTLAMYLYEYAYNKYNNEVVGFFEELSCLKTAVRTESAAIESSIKMMADEFLNIDLFCRRLNDEYHPGDTQMFREYMKEFSDNNTMNMMNLKVKIQNAQSMANNVANYYGITLEEGKPESLFKIVQDFVDCMDKAKRTLIKLEKERQKAAIKRQKEREKKKKQKEKEAQNGGGTEKKEQKKEKWSLSKMMDRKKEREQQLMEEEEKGNLLFHDIKMAAAKFSQRQNKMEKRLSTNFIEKKAMSKGLLTPSMQNDKIKKRMSTQIGLTQIITADEAQKLRDIAEGDHDDELSDDQLNKMQSNKSAKTPKSPNTLMVPT